MNFGRLLLRVAVGHLAATLKKGNSLVFVRLRDCPKPTSSVGIDQHLQRAYCRREGRDCPMLQMVLSDGESIVCKGINAQERIDK